MRGGAQVILGSPAGAAGSKTSRTAGPCSALRVGYRAPGRGAEAGRSRAEGRRQEAPRTRKLAAAGSASRDRPGGRASLREPKREEGGGASAARSLSRGVGEARAGRARVCTSGAPIRRPGLQVPGCSAVLLGFSSRAARGLGAGRRGLARATGSGVNKGETLSSTVIRVQWAGSRSAPPAHVSAEPSVRPPGTAVCGGAAVRRPAPLARPLSVCHADPQQCVRSPGVPERLRPPRADPSGSWGLGGGGGGAESWGAHLGPPGHGGEGGPEHLHRLEGGKM